MKVQWGYNELTVGVQWGYNGSTVRAQWGYCDDAVGYSEGTVGVD